MQKNKVYINAPMFESSDLDEFIMSKYNDNTEFDTFLEHGIIDPGMIHCVFIVLQNIGYDAIYDLIKYCVLHVYNIVHNKNIIDNKDMNIKIEFSEESLDGKLSNHKTISISTSYKMNVEEREKVICNALENFLRKQSE